MEDFNNLFSDDSFNGKLDFLNDRKKTSNDGLYKPDMSLVKDKSRGYRATLRFLPNVFKDENGKLTMGQTAITTISHFVNIKDNSDLSGKFDSPKNFGDPCTLSSTYYQLNDSKNAILKEKAKSIQYSNNNFSYVLIIEDEQQPELVGKIMVYRYGKTIQDIIKSEQNGEIGDPCNIFHWATGKDFKLIITETGGAQSYPDYKKSGFVPTPSSVKVYNADKAMFKNIPLTDDGRNIHPEYQGRLIDFLLNREHEITEFEPKRLTEEQKEKNRFYCCIFNW